MKGVKEMTVMIEGATFKEIMMMSEIGVRGLQEERYEIGDECRWSYDWDHEYDLSTYDLNEDHPDYRRTVGGTSAIIVPANDWRETDMATLETAIAAAIERDPYYRGTDMVLIGGHDCRCGDDPGEIIIADAVVVARITIAE